MRRFILHPFFFGLMPLTALVASNAQSIHPRYAARPLFVILLVSSVAVVLAYTATKDLRRSGILATASISLFLTYGHVVSTVTSRMPSIEPLLVQAAVAALWGIAFIAMLRMLRRSRFDAATVTRLLNIVGLVGLALPLYQVSLYELTIRESWPGDVEIPIPANGLWEISSQTGTPDIYYIVLDGYGRADVLHELYALDNSTFLDALRKRGFFIAGAARSNYSQTHLSLASSLNMDYLDFLVAAMGSDSGDHTPIDYLIGHNNVSTLLKSLEYRIVTLNSGYRRTEIRDADTYLNERIVAVTPLESVLIEHSAMRLLLDVAPILGLSRWYPGYEAHRDLVAFELEQLRDAAQIPGPKFVFAHIMSPHPPFVFDRNGNSAESTFPYSAKDGDLYPGTQESYVAGYRDQLTYLNSVVLQVVDSLIEDSDTVPVIVLQGDHGPGSLLQWDHPQQSNLNERMAILNAIYLPHAASDWMREGLSPVNTFRIIFRELFGARVDSLEDHSFFSGWRFPYDLSEVGGPEEPSK